MAEFNQDKLKAAAPFAMSSARKNYLPYILFALLLVLVAGGVYYFSLSNPTEPAAPAAVTPPTVTPTPTPTPAPVSVLELQNEADALKISTDSADLTDLNKDIQGL